MEDITRGIESENGSAGNDDSGIEHRPEPVKRGPGRPKKSDSATSGIGSTDDIGAEPTIGEHGSGGDRGGDSGGVDTGSRASPGKRGRKPGTAKKTAKADRINTLGNVLNLLHGTVSRLTNLPELMINPQECGLLSEAMVDCADAWGWNPVTDPRLMATITLAGIVVIVYGPRVKIVKTKLDQRKNEHYSQTG